jgi:hypothetical protein
MKKLFLLLVVGAVAVLSYKAGYSRGQREADAALLGHSLEKITFAALNLNTLAENRPEATRKLLEQQLRSGLETAEKFGDATLDTHIPNLIDGVRRAKKYSDRLGDSELSKRFADLYAKLEKRSPSS